MTPAGDLPAPAAAPREPSLGADLGPDLGSSVKSGYPSIGDTSMSTSIYYTDYSFQAEPVSG